MGATKFNSMTEEALKHVMKITLELLEGIDREVSKSLLLNEQFVLDFYDEVNKISVRK